MLSLVLLLSVVAFSNSLNLLSRTDWGARPATSTIPMANPVPYVVIHHSAIPPVCYTQQECIEAMQKMQDMHQFDNGWNDIGYSFAVGGDGNAYEGRGWSTMGAHAPGYNNKSIGICVIGNWMEVLPNQQQLETVHELIQFGVDLGMIQNDYTLIGHRQVKETLCPGDQLFQEIATWDHFEHIELNQK